jgi:hypothetical protein
MTDLKPPRIPKVLSPLAGTPDPTLADLAHQVRRLEARVAALDAALSAVEARLARLEQERTLAPGTLRPHPESYWLKSALYRADPTKEGA